MTQKTDCRSPSLGRLWGGGGGGACSTQEQTPLEELCADFPDAAWTDGYSVYRTDWRLVGLGRSTIKDDQGRMIHMGMGSTSRGVSPCGPLM